MWAASTSRSLGSLRNRGDVERRTSDQGVIRAKDLHVQAMKRDCFRLEVSGASGLRIEDTCDGCYYYKSFWANCKSRFVFPGVDFFSMGEDTITAFSLLYIADLSVVQTFLWSGFGLVFLLRLVFYH